HQDVLFPAGWLRTVKTQLQLLPDNAAIVGLVGCTRKGCFRGHVIDPHGHAYWGPLPTRVTSLDEHVLLVRPNIGLRFDESIPHFHCYGTDIVLAAEAAGYTAHAVDAPVVHLSGGQLDASFDESAKVLLDKWGKSMGGVIPTCAKLLSTPDRAFWRYASCRLARYRSRHSASGGLPSFRTRYSHDSALHANVSSAAAGFEAQVR
ncbi:MAG: hypothetical protein ACNA8P_10915, partial [Phycisphaerales bacterium]